jgi:uncharacterized membrane protein
MVLGLGHLSNASSMKGLVPEYFPQSIIWVYATGVALILAGLAIIINKKARLASLLLGIMLILFALLIHLPGLNSSFESSFPNLMKDLALAGAAIFFSAKLKN